jgi:uncharacterized repeat protein (TIGR02543 family)
MEEQEFTYDQPQNLREKTFTRSGYTFSGWNTQSDGNGTSYEDKQNVSNLSTTS